MIWLLFLPEIQRDNIAINRHDRCTNITFFLKFFAKVSQLIWPTCEQQLKRLDYFGNQVNLVFK